MRLSPHVQTNIAVIEWFLGVEFRIRDAKGLVTVALQHIRSDDLGLPASAA
jgi:RNA 3'-terminal phosphate cyclase